MDISKHLQHATIPMLKHICEEHGFSQPGSSKTQIVRSILAGIEVDVGKEEKIRDMVTHLLREKNNKMREEKNRKKSDGRKDVVAEVHNEEDKEDNDDKERNEDKEGKEDKDGKEDKEGKEDEEEKEDEEDKEDKGDTEVSVESQGDLFASSQETETAENQKGGARLLEIDGLQQIVHDLRPKSTSSAKDARSDSVLVVDDLDSTEMNDARTLKALTGKGLDDSVFVDGYMEESFGGGGLEVRKSRQHQVRFSEPDHDPTEDKFDILISMFLELRKEMGVELKKIAEDRNQEREETAKHIEALEENAVALKALSETAMGQIKDLHREKENSIETISKQANVILETAHDLKKERIGRHEDQQQYAKDIKEIKDTLKTMGAEKKKEGIVQRKEVEKKNEEMGPIKEPKTKEPKAPGDGKVKADGIVLLVGDANIDPLIPKLLHGTKEVRKLKRSTIAEAWENMAACSEPGQVTDVILQVGANDMRKGADGKEVKAGINRLQCKYKEKFKKARVHITALPPTEQAKEANFHLRELAGETKNNFISLKGMKDRATQRVSAGMIQVNSPLYTARGTITLAREIKRSLYSNANLVKEDGKLDITSITNQFAAILSQQMA